MGDKMEKDNKETDKKGITAEEMEQVLTDPVLIEKWIQQRQKETVEINVSDIILREKVHKSWYKPKLPDNFTSVTGTIIVRPDLFVEGKYALVRGWILYKYAKISGQEKINVYITHSERKRFAIKLRKIKEEMEKLNV